MADELTKALLTEEVVAPSVIGEALFASVTSRIPLVQALVDTGAVTNDVLGRYLGRADAPFLRHVVPVPELVERLPPGLAGRLYAIPVRRDAITGTIDVVVADPSDPHPGKEISFHLRAPVRLVRAPLTAIDDALRRLRTGRTRNTVDPPARDDEGIYDSRPRPSEAPPPSRRSAAPRSSAHHTFPPPAPLPRAADLLEADAIRPAQTVPSVRPPGYRAPRNTPPWGTPVHNAHHDVHIASEPPKSNLGSEIPIPLTRRTFTAVSGGTQRPPPLIVPGNSLGEGYPVDPSGLRAVVEHRAGDGRSAASFIPGPPPLPGSGAYAAYAPQMPFSDVGGILAALRAAGSRDEVLELVLTGARMVAFKVAIFVVKRGGYLGWACTPEFGDRSALQSVLLPLDAASIFNDAVHDGLYLGPIRHDETHTALLHVMRGATRDVAAVPIRVSGKTAVVLLADELGDTMLATRRLEELARAAGDAFTRIVRMRR